MMGNGKFDEMQTQRREHIGSQSFILLVLLLMVNTLLFSLGIRWFEYPTDVWVIVLISCGVYIVRAAASGVLLAPGQHTGKPAALFLIVFVLALAVVAAFGRFVRVGTVHTGFTGGGAVVLEVVSWGSLAAAAVAAAVRHHRDRGDDR